MRALVVVLLAGLAHAEPPAKTSALVAKGKDVYGTVCLACHGVRGMGNGPVAFAIKPPPRNFVIEPFKAGDSPAQIFATITNGLSNSTMAGYPQLAPEQRWALAYYVLELRSAGRRDSAP